MAVFEVTTADNKLEKIIEFETGSRLFEINAGFAQLLLFSPDLADYAREDDPEFYKLREAALDEMRHKLESTGFYPLDICHRETMVLPFLHLWLSHIFRSLSKTPEDSFFFRHQEYQDKYQILFRDITMDNKPSTANRTKLKRG